MNVTERNPVFQHNTHLWRESLGGTLKVRHSSSFNSFYLNDGLALIWRHIDARRTVDQVFKAVIEADPSLDTPAYREDFDASLSALEQLGLIREKALVWQGQGDCK